MFNIKYFKKEFEVDNLRSDGLIGIESKESQKKYLLALEVEISNNNLKKKIKKYERRWTSLLTMSLDRCSERSCKHG